MMPGVALPVGLSLALILAEPVLRAHPERHVLPPGVRVAGDIPVTARRTKVAAGHPPPLGATERPLPYHPPPPPVPNGEAGRAPPPPAPPPHRPPSPPPP